MSNKGDIIIGIDAGTSVLKAVAFTLSGQQIGVSSVRNTYYTGAHGAVTQSLYQTWNDCVQALRGLSEKIPDLAKRTAAVSVTAQGDGTWLVDRDNKPVGAAWIWLDARAAPTVTHLSTHPLERARFEATGTGLNTCQQGAQMAHMDATVPELLDQASVVLHCKDWLYLNLTGVRATDPSEASFTFGNFRTRQYDDTVIEALGLQKRRYLLPEIIEGSQLMHSLTDEAAAATGLRAGTPVSLAYVDMAATALGAGVYGGGSESGCSTIGSTGVHMRAKAVPDILLNKEGTGYVIALPIPGIVTQVQTNMGATINIDWILQIAADLISSAGTIVALNDLIPRLDDWFFSSRNSSILYHPYISEAGERGPFVNAHARANFIGLSSRDRFPELVRSVVEGLAMATRDCYTAMGALPSDLRLTGGAARSRALRHTLGAVLGASVRVSEREEAGAAGAAMMSAVALGVYPSMEACIAEWVTPLLGTAESPDLSLIPHYEERFTTYQEARLALSPIWSKLASDQ